VKKYAITLLLLLFSVPALSASFPHTRVISTSITKGPMTNITTSTYMFYDGNEKTAITAEWSTQQTPVGKKRKFTLTKGGYISSLDLDTKRCIKTNIQAVTESVQDPEALSASIKKQMGLKKAGACEGAGYQGVKYTSSFGEMCFYKDVFLLWQKGMGIDTRVTSVKFDVNLPKDKITLPAGIKCVAGPDLSQGWQGMQSYGQQSSESSDAAGSSQQQAPQPSSQPSPQNMDDAMKMLQDMFGQ